MAQKKSKQKATPSPAIEGQANTHKAPIEGDGIPDANQSHLCQSCGEPITALHCGACGQKNDNYRRSVFALLGEFFGSFLSYDSRVWRSWGALIYKPGRVPRAYADGARTRYTSPVRSYICVSVLLFLFLGIFQIDILQVRLQTVEPGTGGTVVNFGDGAASVQPEFKFLSPRDKDFQSNITGDEVFERLDIEVEGDNADVAASNLRTLFQNVISNPTYLDGVVRTWLPRLIFIMIPVAILLGKLFLWGRRALIYDHAVHALYIHSVLFMGLIVATVLGLILPKLIVFPGLILFFLIYVPLSTKCMFERGWFRTLLTSYGVMLIYFLCLLAVMTLILVIRLSTA